MRKLWNRPALPVYSLVTRDAAGQANMNICTYVTAVSMSPKLFQVAVYQGTQTRTNVRVGELVLLQLLSVDQAPLTRLLGHTSGKKTDKISRLKNRVTFEPGTGLPYLTDCCGYVVCRVTDCLAVGGDHDLVILAVLKQKNLSDAPILTTDIMRARGYLR